MQIPPKPWERGRDRRVNELTSSTLGDVRTEEPLAVHLAASWFSTRPPAVRHRHCSAPLSNPICSSEAAVVAKSYRRRRQILTNLLQETKQQFKRKRKSNESHPNLRQKHLEPYSRLGKSIGLVDEWNNEQMKLLQRKANKKLTGQRQIPMQCNNISYWN